MVKLQMKRSVALGLALCIPAFLFILAPTSTVRAIDCTDPMYANDAECAGITPDSPAPAVDCSDPAFSNNTECSGVSDSAPASASPSAGAALGNATPQPTNQPSPDQVILPTPKGTPSMPTLQNPLKTNSVEETLLLIADIAMDIGVIIAVIMIIYAGFKFVTALGDPGKLKDAKGLLLSVIIGLAILLGAKAIVGIVKNTLIQANVVDKSAFTNTQ